MTVFVVPFDTVSPGTAVSNNMGSEYLCWSPLGSDKYIVGYRQISTNGYVVRVITYNGPTAAPTMGPVNLIQPLTTAPYSEFQRVRIYENPSSPNSAFLLYSSSVSGLYIQFLDISETGVVTSNTPVNVFGNTYFSVSYSNMFEMISNTKLIGIYNTSSVSSKSFITLDFENKTFSVSEREQLAVRADYTSGASRMRAKKIPDTTKTLIHDGVSLYEVDADGTTTRTYNTSTWGLRNGWNIEPIGPTSLLHTHYYDNNIFLRRIEDGVPQGLNFASCTNDLGFDFNMVIPLEPYQVMAFAESSSSINIQTVRLLTDGIGECSVLTHKSGGMKLNTSSSAIKDSLYSFSKYYTHYHPTWHKRADGSIVYWFIADGGNSSTSRLAFKILYIPSDSE